MDAILRALARRYELEPSLSNAQEYIRALERTIGVPDGNPLMDIWGSLILGLFDPNGIILAVYDSLLDLTRILFGQEAVRQLQKAVDGADGRFFLEEGSEGWFNSYLRRIGYRCQVRPDCTPKPCAVNVQYTSLSAGPRSIWRGEERCACPGCYVHAANGKIYMLCWHHYQILESGPGPDFFEELWLVD